MPISLFMRLFPVCVSMAALWSRPTRCNAPQTQSSVVFGFVKCHLSGKYALRGASATTKRVADEIDATVTRMPFQDRATQSIDNLRSVLGIVANSIFPSTDPAPDGSALLKKLERAILLGDMKQRVHSRITGMANDSDPPMEPSGDSGSVELF